jgi:hypothetical protein
MAGPTSAYRGEYTFEVQRIHDLNRTGRRDKARFREAIQKHARPEEMIAVPVSCIIHHHCVSQTLDERRPDRRPGWLVFTRRKIGCHDGILGVNEGANLPEFVAKFWESRFPTSGFLTPSPEIRAGYYEEDSLCRSAGQGRDRVAWQNDSSAEQYNEATRN